MATNLVEVRASADDQRPRVLQAERLPPPIAARARAKLLSAREGRAARSGDGKKVFAAQAGGIKQRTSQSSNQQRDVACKSCVCMVAWSEDGTSNACG